MGVDRFPLIIGIVAPRRVASIKLPSEKDKPLTIEIKTPELEALIQERLRDSGFTSLDELLTRALESLPEAGKVAGPSPKPAKRLVDVLTSPPFAGSGLTIERLKQYPTPAVLL